MLSAAGFSMVPANSPSKLSILQSLPPLTVSYYLNKHNEPMYWFADPYQCNCLYQGNQRAYQQYQAIRLRQQEVREEEQAAELNQDAAMQMNMFDPFYFP